MVDLFAGASLTDFFNRDLARLWADKIKTEQPDFASGEFVAFVTKQLAGKTMTERQWIFAEGLVVYLGDNHLANLALLGKVLGPELATEVGMFRDSSWLFPAARYVEKYGLSHRKASLAFIRELTKRFTGEWAIRPYLAASPKIVTKELVRWSRDENVHIRRLASEGMRISLPWAKKSLVCLDEWETYKIILTNLKNDPSRFVQRSVGNNLNDLYRHDAKYAKEIIEEWQQTELSPATAWIVKHGQRSLRQPKNQKDDTIKK